MPPARPLTRGARIQSAASRPSWICPRGRQGRSSSCSLCVVMPVRCGHPPTDSCRQRVPTRQHRSSVLPGLPHSHRMLRTAARHPAGGRRRRPRSGSGRRTPARPGSAATASAPPSTLRPDGRPCAPPLHFKVGHRERTQGGSRRHRGRPCTGRMGCELWFHAGWRAWRPAGVRSSCASSCACWAPAHNTVPGKYPRGMRPVPLGTAAVRPAAGRSAGLEYLVAQAAQQGQGPRGRRLR
jgi:hypothetical protein